MEAGWDTDGETIRWRKDLAGLEDVTADTPPSASAPYEGPIRPSI